MYNRDIEKPRNFFLKTLKQKLELDKKPRWRKSKQIINRELNSQIEEK